MGKYDQYERPMKQKQAKPILSWAICIKENGVMSPEIYKTKEEAMEVAKKITAEDRLEVHIFEKIGHIIPVDGLPH